MKTRHPSRPRKRREATSPAARYKRLYEVSKVIHSTLEPQETLQLIVEQAVKIVGASSGSVVLVNPNTRLLEIHAAAGLSKDGERVRLRLGAGITGWVALHGESARANDVRKDPRYVELRELASQASLAIRNTWLYEQLRLKARLFETLATVGQTINSTLNLTDALVAITRETAKLMHAKTCSLMLLDPSHTRLELRASHGAGSAYRTKPPLDVDESLLGVVVRRQRPLQVENVQTSSRYQSVEVARSEGLVSLLSVPLVFGKTAIGTLNVYTGTPYSFSNEEIRILSALAELSALAIEKARLYEHVVDIEEQLRRNEKLSALGLLAAEVAHEIRNPLTVMKMLYHSLDLRFPEEDARAKDARMIGEKMEHLNRIVERVLDLSRSAEPAFAPVNLNTLIEELALLVRHKLRNQKVDFVRQLEPRLPDVIGDATQLEQALLNLVLNAAEAMPNGGMLTMRSLQPAGAAHVRVEVQDTGPGMSEPDRQKAFTSLLQSSKTRGAGLGLAIVGRIVESHRGTVSIQTAPGEGTTVVIELPLE